MIERPSSADTGLPSIDGLAAAIAEMLAHLYDHASLQLEPFRPDPRVDQVLNVLFTATADLHDLSGHSSGNHVRVMLGDA